MKQIITDRRALHRIPELDRELDRTMAYLRAALKGLRCRVFAPIPNSLCAFFDNESDSAIAFRCGCDGLPVHERSFLPFSSEIPGQMHAGLSTGVPSKINFNLSFGVNIVYS